MITSLQNPRVKLIYALQNRAKARRKERKIVLEGPRLIRDACELGHAPKFVFHTSDADEAFVEWLTAQGVDIAPVDEAVMRHISDTQQPQGVIGVFPLPVPEIPPSPTHVLILDGLRDPGNMGTILRTAAAAGVDVVLLSSDCVAPYNPKVLRGGMGAHFRLPVIQASWSRIGEICAGLRVYLADGDGAVRYDTADWSSGWALIIGSEAHGASDDAAQLADAHVAIPLASAVESLNAAVAAAVLLFEARRQNQ